METLQLYRSRLAGPKQALQLVQDLNRGKRIPRAEAAVADAGEIGVKPAAHITASLVRLAPIATLLNTDREARGNARPIGPETPKVDP